MWYADIPPQVFAEEYIDTHAELKFHCVNGEPLVIEYVSPLDFHSRGWYDTQGRELRIRDDDPVATDKFTMDQDTLRHVIALVTEASAEFDHVRLDVYVRGSDTYLGEYTFSPGGYHFKWHPETFELLMGTFLTKGRNDHAALRVIEAGT